MIAWDAIRGAVDRSGLEEIVKARLQSRAIRHGQSMEAEARDIIRDALKREDDVGDGLGTRIVGRFRGIGLKPDEAIDELRAFVLQNPFRSLSDE